MGAKGPLGPPPGTARIGALALVNACPQTLCTNSWEAGMAKKARGGVYRIVDVVGVSKTSWEDAGRRAVETAATSIRDLRIAEVTKMDMTVENGKVSSYRTRVALSFKYES